MDWILPLIPLSQEIAGSDGYSQHNACPLPSGVDHDIEEMECLFQKQLRTMATGQHVTKYKQSNPRSRDICDNRTEPTRKNVAGGGDGEGGASLCSGRRHSDDGQQLGGGHSLSLL